jgi:hypothetical protein
MINIDKFAFCFFSSDINDVIRQEIELTKLSNKYQIERWYRHDRNNGKYVSFSQMVNDAIDDTDSEFMLFCNPKTNLTSDDIEFVLNKLSTGYCFASVVSFGFFGFSKELIRRIGMLDERFIGGEYEDDDFSIRLKHFGKSTWWGYDYDKYDKKISKSGNLRHITASIFNQKYKIKNNLILINSNNFTHKKISKRHREFKEYIYDSWLGSEYNGGNGKMYDYLTKYNTILLTLKISEVNANFNFILNRNNEDFKMELISDKKINLHITFLSDILNGRHYLWNDNIESNCWKTFKVFSKKNVEVRVFLEDNQIYNTTISNIDNINLNFQLPVTLTDN